MPEVLYIALFIAVIASLIIKVRGNILDSKILKSSVKIKSIINLNKSINFSKLNKSFTIRKYYDNKSYYRKIEPGYLFSSYVRENLEYFSSYINMIKKNRKKKTKYDYELSIINSRSCDNEYKKLKISKKEYMKREENIANSIIIEPTTECTLHVYMSYSSPKGQVKLYKGNSFTFEDLLVAFDSMSRTYFDKETYSKLALVERGEISDSLRYDILKRDNFKCAICGASSREGVRLHVDHIIPVSKGGKSEPNNLRTLCERCNVGKSDKIENVQTIKSKSVNIKTQLCPECGAKLVLRNGKHGRFYGCSNYPKCKFTKNA